MDVANDLVVGDSVGKTCNLFKLYKTADGKWNGSPQQQIRGQHGESDHYFFGIASNHRADQSTEEKHEPPAFGPDPDIKLQISVLGYTCLPLLAKKESYSDKRTWLPHS
jgi:hypothetical protein